VPVQAVPEAHPAFYKMGTGLLAQGLKRTCLVVDHSLRSSAEVKERVQLYRYSPTGPSWSVLGLTSAFYLFSINTDSTMAVRMQEVTTIMTPGNCRSTDRGKPTAVAKS
jgi:hypothetical protein